jgi:hypothetical protein
MSAIDMVKGGTHDDGSLDAPGQASPPRPTMNGEHLGPQFADVTTGNHEPPTARHPNYVGDRTLADYRTSLK